MPGARREGDPIIWYVHFPRMNPQRLALSCRVAPGGRRIVLLDNRLRRRPKLQDTLLAKLVREDTEVLAYPAPRSELWKRLERKAGSHGQEIHHNYRSMKDWQLKVEFFSAMASGWHDDAQAIVQELERREASRKQTCRGRRRCSH